MNTAAHDDPQERRVSRLLNRPMKRSTVFKTLAGVVGGGLAAGGASMAYADKSPGSGQHSTALAVKKIADLTGPDLTSQFRMAATDLGIPAVTPDGRKIFVFGDTFEQAAVGSDFWRSPVALYSDSTDLNAGIKWSGAVGGDVAQQLWEYEHDNPEFSTVLPSDVITIGNTMYLHVMANNGLMNVVWTEIWKSDDSGATWQHTGAKFPADQFGGLFQLLTWEVDGDYVYIYSTEFSRKRALIMSRVPASKIADPQAYEPWGYADGKWDWGNAPTPIMEGAFGELCLRKVDGKWLFTWFNAGNGPLGSIDGIVMDSPSDDLTKAKHEVFITGCNWGEEDDSHVAQLYGGYVISGSTLGELHLAVSQWNTDAGWPYRVMQHRVTGFA